MLFHEIYGCYYTTVARILERALEQPVGKQDMQALIQQYAFGESVLTLLPALCEQEWPLLTPEGETLLRHKPTMPPTTLQLRWLKAISLDPRIQLFDIPEEELRDIPPLFTPEQIVLFDQYADGDPFEEERYIRIFRTILQALREGRMLRVTYISARGSRRCRCCVPHRLEYSEKDDKFRLLTLHPRKADTINLNRMTACELLGPVSAEHALTPRRQTAEAVLEVVDDRNALERALLHFAHFEKRAEQIAPRRYRLTIRYDCEDEAELVIRVLSFGPLVKAVEPPAFCALVRERVERQKQLLFFKETAE